MTVHQHVHSARTYPELLAEFQPRVIRSEAQADEVRELLDAMTDVENPTPDQRDFIGLLGQLLHAWESEHEPLVDVSPQVVVQALLDENGLRQVDLVPDVFPTASTVSDFLAGRRRLSYERVMKLAQFFHVSPAAFFPARGSATIPSEEHGAITFEVVRFGR